MTALSERHRVLSINSGSSSIKFAVYDFDFSKVAPLTNFASGRLVRLGMETSRFIAKASDSGEELHEDLSMLDHEAALDRLWKYLKAINIGPIKAIGHRIVHGGSLYRDPQRITPGVLKELRRLAPMAAEHLPHELRAVDFFGRKDPQIPQVACFDTSFHQGMPRVAKIFPIPRRFEGEGIIRYGFHGISCEYVMERLRQEPDGLAGGRVVIAHLGNGASMTAVKQGRSMDTTMGFTPSGGLMMSTRSGDLDPGVIFYLLREGKMTQAELAAIIDHMSGLLGVSGKTSDMEDLLKSAQGDNPAAEAVSLFCYQAKKYLGALCFAMGGLDALIFTGGIGEQAPEVRHGICEGLDAFGLLLDKAGNEQNRERISAAGSPVEVRVMKTDEELMIARHTVKLLE